MAVILAFDCAVAGLSVALVRDGRPLAALTEAGREQSARLLPAIDGLLRDASIMPRDLVLIGVTVGPGSFTGVRVGLAAAHGLAIGLDIPLAGLATTEVLLAQAPPPGPRLRVAVIDSRLGDWFCALEDERQPLLVSSGGLRERLRGRPCFLIGAGAQRLATLLAQDGMDAIGHEAVPDAVILARLAAGAGPANWRARNRHEGLPRPLYLRGVNVTSPDGARRTVE
jgi:tRNA threonylcarbamoyladenosine biosynthesis protein TsaB